MSAARQFAARTLAAMHPHLSPAETHKGGALTAAAHNLRVELRHAFPGVRFSVRTERFSMGDALRISWTDGPTVAQLEALSDRYKGGDFDGMTDCYNYRRDAWRDAFGSAKYVTTNRGHTPRAVASALRTLRAQRCDVPETVTAAAFEAGTLPGDWSRPAWHILSRRTWCVTRPQPAPRLVAEVQP